MKLLGATLLVTLAASSAFADGKMRVMEVSLGGTSHADSQFVELASPGDSFPQIYSFVVYDSNGSSIAAQSLPLSDGTTRVVMANSSAQDEYKLHPGTEGTVSIVNLQSVLPATGSVCFRRQDGGAPRSAAADQAGTRLHCMGWGPAASFPASVGGTEHADAPPAGMSLQKLAGCLQVDPPTPNAPSKQACQIRSDKPILPVDAAPEIDAAPADVTPDEAPPVDAARPIDARVEPPPIDAAMPATGVPENGVVGSTKSKGCNAGGDGSWFGVVGLAGLGLAVRSRRKRS